MMSARHKPWLRQGWRLILLLLASGFLIHNAQAHAPTMDEQNHMARGYALLRTGDPRLSVEHPPLINLLEALPLGRGVTLPVDTAAWESGNWYEVADLFLWKVNSLPDRMVFLSRMPVVWMTVLLGALVTRWARELGGAAAASMVPALILLDPNILAHGSLATTDLGLTFTTTLAAYTLWRLVWVHGCTRGQAVSPRVGVVRWLAAGLAVGAMLASKTSALAFWGSFGLTFVGSELYDRQRGRMVRRVSAAAVRYFGLTLVGLLALWATYAFQLAPVVEGGIPVPMGTYWQGIRTVFRNVQGGRPSYLLGETRLGGWPLYFPITFAVKTPLPTLMLVLMAAFLPVMRRQTGAQRYLRQNFVLLTPVVIYWVGVLSSDLNLGYRHLLPTLPLLYLWAASRWDRVERPGWRGVRAALILGLALATLWIAPHFLAYFNPIGGGPERGWRVVADSNIDWGQDLKRLSHYLRDQGVEEPVRLSWFGSSYPERYGITYEPLPGLPHYFHLWFEPPTFNERQPEPGLYVISVSNLVEIPLEDKHFFGYFREREPDARIGYSIYVYRVASP